MRLTRIFSIIALLCTFALQSALAQSVREEIAADYNKSGGVYWAYQYDNPKQTSAPKGYKPFYISHYGRHGSRWLLHDSEYTDLKAVFDKAAAANVLTTLGKDVYERVKAVYEDGIDRGGDLTPLGAEQHRQIAGRMYKSYPEVFKGNAVIEAKSTSVVRCVLSMAAFCEGLKEQNPKLKISREAGRRTTAYLNFFSKPTNPNLSKEYLDYLEKGEWKAVRKQFANENIHPQRLMSMIFTDANHLDGDQSLDLMLGLFYFAASAQNIDIEVSFYDLFTIDELYALNIYDNYGFYSMRGPSPMNKRYPEYYAKVLIEDVLRRADDAISGNGVSADLRFGHDGNVMPILSLLQFNGCNAPTGNTLEEIAESWSVFRLTPMAANIQLVFYRKKGGDDVLVKFLLNENEVEIPVESDLKPFYHWADVRAFYLDTLNSIADPSES